MIRIKKKIKYWYLVNLAQAFWIVFQLPKVGLTKKKNESNIYIMYL